ncbi:putative Rhoptry kinase family protein, truncated (incomplete catalytic triad) [Neospora caninum Liverpool]|uniref:Putative Rhoptry kinase family protein, truncated (Incomplete catalytic triad) n=1 Tax=Neospora caninum (strain Liverpool) TaxID=572307 RepID=F0VQZ1_NEOCL|nr:putative Rhoptry kinase family protein, truncated (incomplete catalytic triad) [Neospora caninum Liverpool]CBZ56138.1 putative Rhoptry kinase family protein, truncated (incomplete catalytic triad) [Neospora caninum Liverpool]CEL70894.1 TPA: Rhoptry kinase family protein, truncated (incomplete catalytic triad), putative [Neospora caninum Liverpool]|eukprot:XP_003886164.1 putative Rhoptry kinase family protein, truncated (incomplete catalytic triad) [Neospora caninum Liverpool]
MQFSTVLCVISTLVVGGTLVECGESGKVYAANETADAAPASSSAEHDVESYQGMGESPLHTHEEANAGAIASESGDSHPSPGVVEGAGGPLHLVNGSLPPFEEDIELRREDTTRQSLVASVSQQPPNLAKVASRVAAPLLAAFGQKSASHIAPRLDWAFVRDVLDDMKDFQTAGLGIGAHTGDQVADQARQKQSFYWMSPWRWWMFYVKLPDLEVKKYEEMKDAMRAFENSSEPVTRQVYAGSAELARALGIPPAALARGFTVKICHLSTTQPWKALTETFLRKTFLLPDWQFFVPLLAAARGTAVAATFQFFPRTRGSLRQLATQVPQKLNVVMVMAEMVAAVEALHRLGILHRSLSLDVFYVNREGHIQLGDFENATLDGVYRPISDMAKPVQEVYMRVLRRFNVAVLQTPAADVFCLGKAFESLADLTDLEGQERLLVEVAAARMTQAEAEKRLSLQEVMENKLFEGVDFGAVRARKNPSVYGSYALRETLTSTDGNASTWADDSDDESLYDPSPDGKSAYDTEWKTSSAEPTRS